MSGGNWREELPAAASGSIPCAAGPPPPSPVPSRPFVPPASCLPPLRSRPAAPSLPCAASLPCGCAGSGLPPQRRSTARRSSCRHGATSLPRPQSPLYATGSPPPSPAPLARHIPPSPCAAALPCAAAPAPASLPNGARRSTARRSPCRRGAASLPYAASSLPP
ncbi:Os07g0188901 [Oryza sativa Japonica Group]|uniref:Os07g0188901 protein n=1 Tax=Oryza sativa subsp. japonica TaxID=39947 RepID=A0A0P0X3N3_ORYSJ|nr:Os07g0188901 [Oryza sativa Japonica Group]